MGSSAQVPRSTGQFADQLGSRESSRRRSIDPHGGKMHDSAYAGQLAGPKQRDRALDVNGGRRVAWAALQRPGAIHNGVDPGKML
jgi:hypothetical protein